MPLSEFHLLMKKERKAGEAVDEDVRKFIADKVHIYLDPMYSEQMAEVHINDLISTQKRKLQRSVKNNTGRELVIFEQDEAIFRTTHLNNNVWYVDNQSYMRRKGMGVGIMVS